MRRSADRFNRSFTISAIPLINLEEIQDQQCILYSNKTTQILTCINAAIGDKQCNNFHVNLFSVVTAYL